MKGGAKNKTQRHKPDRQHNRDSNKKQPRWTSRNCNQTQTLQWARTQTKVLEESGSAGLYCRRKAQGKDTGEEWPERGIKGAEKAMPVFEGS